MFLQSMLLLFFFTNIHSTEAVLTKVSHMHCSLTVVTLLLPLIFIALLQWLSRDLTLEGDERNFIVSHIQ
jgi:hypothetical protein